eukprot:582676-Pyramimonas_sp.AAC.2
MRMRMRMRMSVAMVSPPCPPSPPSYALMSPRSYCWYCPPSTMCSPSNKYENAWFNPPVVSRRASIDHLTYSNIG